MVPLAVASLVTGAIQAGTSLYGLYKESQKKSPEYTVGPEQQKAYNEAQQRANYGFSPEQTAAFQQNLQQANNTQYRRATDIGGSNLASAVNAGIQSENIGALNQFASQGAQLQQQKQVYAGQLAGGMQSQRNMATQAEIARRNAIEAAYGSGLSSGIGNMAGSLNLTQAMGSTGGANAGARMASRGAMDYESGGNPNDANMLNSNMYPGIAQSSQNNPYQVDTSFGLNKYIK